MKTLMTLAVHEAGHCVVATVLGYQAGAVVTPTNGRAIYSAPIENATHRSAIALGGGLGSVFYLQLAATDEEAHRLLINGKECSASDWQSISTDHHIAWSAFHLAARILRQYRPALIRVAELLTKFGEVNFLEVQAACRLQ